MKKVVTLTFRNSSEQGSTGFIVTAEVFEVFDQNAARSLGKSSDYFLPSDAEVPNLYQRWQSAYQKLAKGRISALENSTTNISLLEDRRNCSELAQQLRKRFNDWLGSGTSLGEIRERLLRYINRNEDEVRILLVSNDNLLQRLPWHSWDLFRQYSNVEFAISPFDFEDLEDINKNRLPLDRKNKILAILGGDQDIDIAGDEQILRSLPNTNIELLNKPSRKTLSDKLSEDTQWDILFFTGHSCSQLNEGIICINDKESLNLQELSNALEHAIKKGLQLAIFNSCDGLGLAQALFKLNIPQVIVMRELVTDKVAEEFLKYFLSDFAKGTPLYLAVRKARRQLQGMEDEFPCASWLPMICQSNPTKEPLTWKKSPDKTGEDVSSITNAPRTPVKRLSHNTFFKNLKKNIWYPVILAIVVVLLIIFVIPLVPIVSPPPPISLAERISNGNRVLIPYKDKKVAFPKEKLEGVTALTAKKLDKAIFSFEKSISIEPNDPETWIYLNNARIGNKDSLKIAVSVPIGENPDVAQEILRGVAQAQDEINQDPNLINGKSLKVLIANDNNDKKTAEGIAKEFVNSKDILAVVGHNSSDASLAAAPEYAKAKLLVISPTSNATSLDNLNKSEYKYYRTLPSIRQDVESLVDYAKKQGWKQIAICLEENDSSTTSLQQEFIKQFEIKVGKVYPNNNHDNKFCLFPSKKNDSIKKSPFNSEEIISKLSQNDVNALLLLPNIDNIEEAIAIAKANKTKKISLIGNSTMYTSKTVELGGESVKDMVFASIWNPDFTPFTPINKDFIDRVTKKWGKINWRTATSYDAMQVIIAGLKNDPVPDRESLRKFMSSPTFDVQSLPSIKNIKDNTDKIIFNESGDRNAQIKLVKIQAKQGSLGYEFKLLPENE